MFFTAVTAHRKCKFFLVKEKRPKNRDDQTWVEVMESERDQVRTLVYS